MLTASSDNVNEGAAATFTVTASAPVAANTTVTLQLKAGNVNAVDTGTTTTNLADFAEGAFTLKTATILAGQSSVNFDVTALADGPTELTETYSVEVKVGTTTLTKTMNVLDGSGVPGQSFALTAGVDALPGLLGSKGSTDTSGNDTITGVFGDATNSNNTYNNGDVIDGGDLTDTLSLIAQDTAASSASVIVRNVEIINILDVDGATFNASLIENAPAINFTNTIAGNTSAVTGAAVASTIGLAGKGDLTVDYATTTGTADTAKVALSSVGTSATVRSTVNVSDGNTIEAVEIAAAGTNFVTLNAGTAAASVTLTGAGTNNIDISAVVERNG